jgi:DNA-binding response OmpR family regulator
MALEPVGAEPARPHHGAAAKKVLIVEDEPNILVSLEFLLKRAGHEVAVARDGSEALRMMPGLRPDLVVLDIMMPVVDGFEVCRRIREDGPPRPKILMLTARGSQTEVAKGVTAGADAYFTKPFATREFVQAVAGLLAHEGGER